MNQVPCSLLPAFLAPAHFSTRAGRNASATSQTPSRISTRRLKTRTAPLTMNARPPLPDDTAVDMLTFALSGPAIIAFIAAAAVGAFLLFSFAEVGPRRPRTAKPFFLRISIPQPRNVEFPDGKVRSLRQGESLFRFDTREMCEAVAKPLRQHGASYTVYKVDGLTVRPMTEWPRELNAPGASWPTDVVREEDQGLGRAWEEYQRIGEDSRVDDEWVTFIERLGGVVVDSKNSPCKLCGGSGVTRCFRCGGVTPVSGGRFKCDCTNGQRPCEWCSALEG